MTEFVKASISVVIPVYLKSNQDLDFLFRALKSISNQTIAPKEVILSFEAIDDISLFLQILNISFAELNLVFLVNSGSPGISSNTNNGLKAVSSKFTHILHQDDFLVNVNAYDLALRTMDFEQTDYAIFASCQLDRKIYPEIDITALVGNNRIGGPSSLFFSSTKHLSFDINLNLLCDVDFVFRLKQRYGYPSLINEIVIEYGVSINQAHKLIDSVYARKEITYILNKWRVSRREIFIYIFDKLPKDQRRHALFCFIQSFRSRLTRLIFRILMQFVKFFL